MKNNVLNLKYAKHLYDKDKSLVEQVWQNESREMSTEDFKTTMLDYADLYQKYDISCVLVDSRQMKYTVEPEVQDWVNANIFPMLMPIVKKLAFLMPSDVFEQVSIQQAIDDHKDDMPIQVSYFDNEEEARQWLEA